MKNSIMIFSVTKQSPNMKEMIIIHGASTPFSMQKSDDDIGLVHPRRDSCMVLWGVTAANAIINALCAHLTQLAGAEVRGVMSSEYDAVFAEIHRWRLNQILVLQMQKYHSITDVAVKLRQVAAPKKKYDMINEQDHADLIAKAKTKKSKEVKVAKLDK